MKRPNKKVVFRSINEPAEWGYLATDIDPLLDELESLRGAEPFPTLEEYEKWFNENNYKMIHVSAHVYDYFAQFKTRTIETMPEVGRVYEFSHDGVKWLNFKLKYFNGGFNHIRPIQTPTRDEVIAKAKELGLTQTELEILCTK